MLETTHRGAKLAALIAAGVVVLGGVAAASGSLPTPAQSAAHDAFGVAGIDVPDGDGAVASDDPVTTTTTSDPTTTTTSASDGSTTDATDPADPADATDVKGPDPTGPAKFGLCTAYAAGQGSTHGHKLDSTAFRALAAAAAGEDESVTEFCADATPGGKPAPTTTTPTTAAAPLTDTGTETATSSSAPATRPPHPAAADHGAASRSHGNPRKP